MQIELEKTKHSVQELEKQKKDAQKTLEEFDSEVRDIDIEIYQREFLVEKLKLDEENHFTT